MCICIYYDELKIFNIRIEIHKCCKKKTNKEKSIDVKIIKSIDIKIYKESLNIKCIEI